MAGTNLPPELWIIVGLIAGLTVVMCLGVLASQMQHERSVQSLRKEVQGLRRHYSRLFAGLPDGSRPAAPPPADVTEIPKKAA